jgi:hypothetical protein
VSLPELRISWDLPVIYCRRKFSCRIFAAHNRALCLIDTSNELVATVWLKALEEKESSAIANFRKNAQLILHLGRSPKRQHLGRRN